MDAFYEDEMMTMARQKHEDLMQQAERERLVRTALGDKEKRPLILEVVLKVPI